MIHHISKLKWLVIWFLDMCGLEFKYLGEICNSNSNIESKWDFLNLKILFVQNERFQNSLSLK